VTRLRRVVWIVPAVLSAALALSGCLPASSPWTGSGPRVAVAGDSEVFALQYSVSEQDGELVFAYYGGLTNALVQAGYQESTSAMVGATTSNLEPFQTSNSDAGWPSPGPQIDVTVLGTNDMHLTWFGTPTTPYATAESNLDNYLNATEGVGSRCHVLVQVPETNPWGLSVSGPTWNAFLDSEAARRIAVIVPWASEIAAHPEYVNADGVHQTTAGKAAYTAALVQATDQCASKLTT
jgi:hypothetical protein